MHVTAFYPKSAADGDSTSIPVSSSSPRPSCHVSKLSCCLWTSFESGRPASPPRALEQAGALPLHKHDRGNARKTAIQPASGRRPARTRPPAQDNLRSRFRWASAFSSALLVAFPSALGCYVIVRQRRSAIPGPDGRRLGISVAKRSLDARSGRIRCKTSSMRVGQCFLIRAFVSGYIS
jgi:hypothetical protein